MNIYLYTALLIAAFLLGVVAHSVFMKRPSTVTRLEIGLNLANQRLVELEKQGYNTNITFTMIRSNEGQDRMVTRPIYVITGVK